MKITMLLSKVSCMHRMRQWGGREREGREREGKGREGKVGVGGR